LMFKIVCYSVPNISQITLPATSPTGGLDRNAPPTILYCLEGGYIYCWKTVIFQVEVQVDAVFTIKDQLLNFSTDMT
jgi:hypothetical protein